MRCNKCKKEVLLWEQMKEWEEDFGNEVDGQAMINIFCDECNESAYIVELFESGEDEEVECPALEEIVKVPTKKKE